MNSILRRHGFNILYFCLLICANVMCLIVPIFFAVTLFFIVPITVYFMKRYNPLAPLAIPLIFAVVGVLATGNNAHLYFLSIYIFAALGLYYALRTRVFYRAVIISVCSVFAGMLFATTFCMILSKKTDFVSIVQNEVLTTNSVYIKTNAEAYFNSAFPTQEERDLFRFPDTVEVPEGVDESEYAVRYVYSVFVGRVLSSNLIMYMVKLSVLLGAGGYLILGVFLRRLGGTNVQPIIAPEQAQLPKGFGLCAIAAVVVAYVMYLAWSYFYPVHLAVYHGVLLAPFALYGVCFMIYVVKLAPNKTLHSVLIGAIIAVCVCSFVTDWVVIIFAIIGLGDYFVNFKKLFKMLLDD